MTLYSPIALFKMLSPKENQGHDVLHRDPEVPADHDDHDRHGQAVEEVNGEVAQAGVAGNNAPLEEAK